MAFERIKVLVGKLQQRFNPDEYSELQRELAAADEKIKELEAVQERQAAEDKATGAQQHEADDKAEQARRLDKTPASATRPRSQTFGETQAP